MGYQYLKSVIRRFRLGQVSVTEAEAALSYHHRQCRDVQVELASLPTRELTPAKVAARQALDGALDTLEMLAAGLRAVDFLDNALAEADRAHDRVQNCRMAMQLEEGASDLLACADSSPQLAAAVEWTERAYDLLLMAEDGAADALYALQMADALCSEATHGSWRAVA